MINSYKQTFGEPQGETPDAIVELASSLYCEFDHNKSIKENADDFVKCIKNFTLADADIAAEEKPLPLSNNDKAHIMDLSFHNANENFYELEDEGVIDDSYASQNNFLEAMEQALKVM